MAYIFLLLSPEQSKPVEDNPSPGAQPATFRTHLPLDLQAWQQYIEDDIANPKQYNVLVDNSRTFTIFKNASYVLAAILCIITALSPLFLPITGIAWVAYGLSFVGTSVGFASRLATKGIFKILTHYKLCYYPSSYQGAVMLKQFTKLLNTPVANNEHHHRIYVKMKQLLPVSPTHTPFYKVTNQLIRRTNIALYAIPAALAAFMFTFVGTLCTIFLIESLGVALAVTAGVMSAMAAGLFVYFSLRSALNTTLISEAKDTSKASAVFMTIILPRVANINYLIKSCTSVNTAGTNIISLPKFYHTLPRIIAEIKHLAYNMPRKNDANIDGNVSMFPILKDTFATLGSLDPKIQPIIDLIFQQYSAKDAALYSKIINVLDHMQDFLEQHPIYSPIHVLHLAFSTQQKIAEQKFETIFALDPQLGSPKEQAKKLTDGFGGPYLLHFVITDTDPITMFHYLWNHGYKYTPNFQNFFATNYLNSALKDRGKNLTPMENCERFNKIFNDIFTIAEDLQHIITSTPLLTEFNQLLNILDLENPNEKSHDKNPESIEEFLHSLIGCFDFALSSKKLLLNGQILDDFTIAALQNFLITLNKCGQMFVDKNLPVRIMELVPMIISNVAENPISKNTANILVTAKTILANQKNFSDVVNNLLTITNNVSKNSQQYLAILPPYEALKEEFSKCYDQNNKFDYKLAYAQLPSIAKGIKKLGHHLSNLNLSEILNPLDKILEHLDPLLKEFFQRLTKDAQLDYKTLDKICEYLQNFPKANPNPTPYNLVNMANRIQNILSSSPIFPGMSNNMNPTQNKALLEIFGTGYYAFVAHQPSSPAEYLNFLLGKKNDEKIKQFKTWFATTYLNEIDPALAPEKYEQFVKRCENIINMGQLSLVDNINEIASQIFNFSKEALKYKDDLLSPAREYILEGRKLDFGFVGEMAFNLYDNRTIVDSSTLQSLRDLVNPLTKLLEGIQANISDIKEISQVIHRMKPENPYLHQATDVVKWLENKPILLQFFKVFQEAMNVENNSAWELVQNFQQKLEEQGLDSTKELQQNVTQLLNILLVNHDNKEEQIQIMNNTISYLMDYLMPAIKLYKKSQEGIGGAVTAATAVAGLGINAAIQHGPSLASKLINKVLNTPTIMEENTPHEEPIVNKILTNTTAKILYCGGKVLSNIADQIPQIPKAVGSGLQKISGSLMQNVVQPAAHKWMEYFAQKPKVIGAAQVIAETEEFLSQKSPSLLISGAGSSLNTEDDEEETFFDAEEKFPTEEELFEDALPPTELPTQQTPLPPLESVGWGEALKNKAFQVYSVMGNLASKPTVSSGINNALGWLWNKNTDPNRQDPIAPPTPPQVVLAHTAIEPIIPPSTDTHPPTQPPITNLAHTHTENANSGLTKLQLPNK